MIHVAVSYDLSYCLWFLPFDSTRLVDRLPCSSMARTWGLEVDSRHGADGLLSYGYVRWIIVVV